MVSVVVPIYNMEKYLARCIDSLLTQEYRDFELILINDGSTDRSAVICREYATKDTRVRLICKPNSGAADARNLGIESSQGEWLTFVDSDDYVAPNYLSTLISLSREYNCDIAQIAAVRVDENGGRCDARVYSGDIKVYSGYEAMEGTLRSNKLDVTIWGKLYNAKLFHDIRFPSGVVIDDVFITYRLVSAANQAVALYVPMYYYTQRTDSIIHSASMLQQLTALQAYEEAMDFATKTYPDCDKTLQARMYYNRIYHHMEKLNRYRLLDTKNAAVQKLVSRAQCTRYIKEIRGGGGILCHGFRGANISQTCVCYDSMEQESMERQKLAWKKGN